MLNAQLHGMWPKANLLSKAGRDLLSYSICGPYRNFCLWWQMGHSPHGAALG